VLVNVAIALVIGPTLLLAPVPESHTLGGAALLLQIALTLTALTHQANRRTVRANGAPGRALRRTGDRLHG
jgi:hypothetical protein